MAKNCPKFANIWSNVVEFEFQEMATKVSEYYTVCLFNYLVSRGSPRQFKLWVVTNTLFILWCKYVNAKSTNGPIFRKDAETKIDTTLFGVNSGSCCTTFSFSISLSLLLIQMLILSSFDWAFNQSISHSNIVTSQCTEMSTSSKLWPAKWQY